MTLQLCNTADYEGYTQNDFGGQGDRQLWAVQPWSNIGANTYLPIPSGVHMVIAADGNAWCRGCPRSERTLRFVAQYYDSSRTPPTTFEVIVDGVPHAMQLKVCARSVWALCGPEPTAAPSPASRPTPA